MIKCLVCEKEFPNSRSIGCHVRRAHEMSIRSYKQRFNLFILCEKCGKEISKRGTISGFCNVCRNRNGTKNPFYGKKHSEEVKSLIKEKTTIVSKKMWKDPYYRNKVIKSASGLKRSDAFKKIQKDNANKQFRDQFQREIRSESMKQTWRLGRMKRSIIRSTSKIEQDFFNEVSKICPYSLEKTSISDGSRTFCPDVVIKTNIIFEFYGDYWHANPRKYNANDVVAYDMLAKDIWERDEKRIKALENNGCVTYVVWEMDYKRDKKAVLEKINIMLNWDNCFLS